MTESAIAGLKEAEVALPKKDTRAILPITTGLQNRIG